MRTHLPLLLVATWSILCAADAHAADEPWTARLVGTWTEPTAGRQSGSDSPLFAVAGEAKGGAGLAIAVERRFGDRLGLEIGASRSDLGFELQVSALEPGIPSFASETDLETWTTWLGLTWHLSPRREGLDLWLGPLVAHVAWDDLAFAIPELAAEAVFDSDSDFVAGAQAGLTVGSGRWRFVSTLRYLHFELDTPARGAGDEGLRANVDPLELGVGIAVAF